jgi:hypothetical protein
LFQRRSNPDVAAFDGALARIALVDRLQFLAGLEAHSFSRRDIYFSARPGIATDSGLARTNVKNAKTAQFNPISLGQRFLHSIEDGLYSQLCLGLSDSSLTYDFIDDVELDHERLRSGFLSSGILFLRQIGRNIWKTTLSC